MVEPVILGKELSVDYTSDDRMYCLDLGLLKEEKGSLVPANPIYAENTRYYFELNYDWDKLHFLIKKFNEVHGVVRKEINDFDAWLLELLKTT